MSKEPTVPGEDEIDWVDAVLAVWERHGLAIATFLVVAGTVFEFRYSVPNRQIQSRSALA